MHKVSIICTNYNKAPWLSEALDSFLRQETTFGFDIIVIDDASTDHSRTILKEYQEKFPEKITLIVNEHNLGIAKTWVKACLYAKGQYIARCDGDDFWTDHLKLQKQVEALEKSNGSKWSNTDFDFVGSDGKLLHANAFESGYIPLTDTYEKVLALKGMTMASTWLVDAELMREVNQKINLETSDDTFDMQLELLQLTPLTYISDSTTVYRLTSNSDSRPTDTPKMLYRIKKLLQTQLDYLTKYPQANMKEIASLLMEQDSKNEIRIHELSCSVHDLQQSLLDKTEQEAKREIERQKVIDEQNQRIFELAHQYNCVINSRRWKYMSTLINLVRRKK
ncbi:glycosyltransferase family 2 protein [Streptococcus castoreus]|uniref:glycosyltransferase family 2 protein n=1 Tax=Streptococcus castoreus TaxID=254786 RepID=UPI00041157EE|nr:glycosyltransferase [Streptococcus castoreus]